MKAGFLNFLKKASEPKLWIQLFIIFHITAILMCFYPDKSPVREKLSGPFDFYTSFFSLYQKWTLFAPSPSFLNIYLKSDVIYKDGSVSTLDFLDLANAQNQIYYAKALDGIYDDNSKSIWPATARFFARKAYKNPQNPPVTVKLWRLWAEVEDPKTSFRSFAYRPQESDLNRALFFETSVHPEDLAGVIP